MSKIVDVNNDDIRTPFTLLDGGTLCDILVRLRVKSLLQRYWGFLFSVDLLGSGVILDQMKSELSSHYRYHDRREILNPVNGLVCFTRHMDKVLIYNPSTGDKTSWIISKVWREYKGFKRPFYGFGFDSKTKEHKVVCLWHWNDAKYETHAGDLCEVLTVGENTWRRIDDVPPYKAYGESVYVNGVVYWLSTYNYYDSSNSAAAKYIVAFDIGREKFRVIPIPDFIADFRLSSSHYSHDLLAIDGCVALLDRTHGDDKNVIKVWIFHDDHNDEDSVTTSSWTEETISIRLEWGEKLIPCAELLLQAITGTNLIIMKPKFYKQQGGVFTLYSYHRKEKTLKYLEISTLSNGKGFLINETVHHYYFGTFVESLYPVVR